MPCDQQPLACYPALEETKHLTIGHHWVWAAQYWLSSARTTKSWSPVAPQQQEAIPKERAAINSFTHPDAINTYLLFSEWMHQCMNTEHRRHGTPSDNGSYWQHEDQIVAEVERPEHLVSSRIPEWDRKENFAHPLLCQFQKERTLSGLWEGCFEHKVTSFRIKDSVRSFSTLVYQADQVVAKINVALKARVGNAFCGNLLS